MVVLAQRLEELMQLARLQPQQGRLLPLVQGVALGGRRRRLIVGHLEQGKRLGYIPGHVTTAPSPLGGKDERHR